MQLFAVLANYLSRILAEIEGDVLPTLRLFAGVCSVRKVLEELLIRALIPQNPTWGF